MKNGEVHENFPLDFGVKFFQFEVNKNDFWTFYSATIILVGLGIAIYFIINDAIDKKTEACLKKHFFTEKVYEQLNITSSIDPSKITYSKEDCQYIVDEARRRTSKTIKAMTNSTECVKTVLEEKFLDLVLLKSALDKHNREKDGSLIMGGILTKANGFCEKKN